MNHDGRSLERPLARRRAGRDACVLLAPCSWGGLAGMEKGGGVDFWQCESSRAPHARIYTRMRTPSIWTRHGAGSTLPAGRSAGPISAMGCDARSTRCKVVGTAAGIEKRREIAHGFASPRPRRANSWDATAAAVSPSTLVKRERCRGLGPTSVVVVVVLGLGFFVLLALTLLQMSKGRGERDVLEDSSPLSPVA